MSIMRAALKHLWERGMTWFVAAFLPLPALLTLDPGSNAQLGCFYLGLASAWLAVEFFPYAASKSRHDGAVQSLALCVAITFNVALFIILALSVGVKSHLPFPLMACLSVTPAIGTVSWLATRLPRRHAAIFVGGVVVLATKLAACVGARIVYGPDYVEQGYVAADWRTAKLMISIFWTATVMLSFILFVADRIRPGRSP